jgi:hypothetical protein
MLRERLTGIDEGGTMQRIIHRGRVLAVLFLSAVVLFAAVPASSVFAQEEPARPESPIEALEGILSRLEEALVKLDEVDLPMLEEQLEAVAGLLAALIEQLEAEAPPEGAENEGPSLREQIIRLDLMLHRLVETLERLVARQEAAEPPGPGEIRAREAVADLKVWIKGYIDGLTRGMRPEEARQFERMVGGLLEALSQHVTRIVHAAMEQHEEPTQLEILLRQIQELVRRLDAFIARHSRRAPNPPPRAPGG